MNKRNASGKWIDKTVLRILTNSAYIGQLVGFQHTTVEGKIVARSKEEHVIIPVPRIIDDDTWERAQYRLEHARHLWYDRRRAKRDYLLSGMCHCSKCGYSMVGSVTKRPNKDHFYYRCSAEMKKLFMKRNCTNRVMTDQLEETVWEFVEKLATDPRTTVALYQEEHEATEALFAESKTRITAIDELLYENSEEQKRLNWMFQKKRCDEDYFEAEWNRLNQERIALERERDKAEKLLKRQEASGRQIEELEAIGREIREAAGNLTFKRKRHILERLKLHVTVPPLGHNARRLIHDERNIVIEVLGYATGVRLKRQTPS